MAWHGTAVRVVAWRGSARQGLFELVAVSVNVKAVRGSAGPGGAGRGSVRYGLVWQGLF